MNQIVAYELLDSMSGSITNSLEEGETREVNRRFLIGQCAGFNDAVANIESYAPQYVDSDGAGIYWRRSRLNVQAVGNKYFDCTATYATLLFKSGNSDDNPQNQANYVPGSVAWDTTGHTEHRTQALQTTPYGNDAPNFEGAINVSGDSVNGIDIVVPNLRYSETWIMPVSVAMSATFVEAVYTQTGTVNLNQFRVFKPGEALFFGARAQWQGDQPYVPVTFDFECRPNVDDFSVGSQSNGIAPFAKEGWQYVWLLYETATDNNRLVRHPIAAYKQTIYKKMDWSAMQIVSKPIAVPKKPERPLFYPTPQLPPADAKGTGGFCWVAREVYGADNPKWLIFREWMMNRAPAYLRTLYGAHGERVAAWLADKPTFKRLVRFAMDFVVSQNGDNST